MHKLSQEMRKVDHAVIVSSLILDASFLATTLSEGKLDTGFWETILVLACVELRAGWCSRDFECRWPMSIYAACFGLYLLAFFYYHPEMPAGCKTADTDCECRADWVKGYFIIGMVMSVITFVLMVYISHREAGKKGDETAEQGWMERAIRHTLGGKSRKAREVGVKFLIYPLMLPFLGILMAFPVVQETISGAIATTFIAFNVITYASDLWKSFTEYIQQQAPESSDGEPSISAARSDTTTGVANHDKTDLRIQIETCTSVRVMDADRQAGA
ncbi:hypothetical protein ACLUWU_07210 [Bifidobacterium thermophilum]|uniref:hypothetical protein n=1 Tax=Bifidobacterium thermophilum TaxID=33905 RepID=UPI0039912157